MKNLLVLTALVLLGLNLSAQKYSTKNGFVGFYSHTSFEDVKADNNQVASILDASTGDIVFQVLNKSFHFEKALMEEHFNENYMESETYPKSTFKGKIGNIKDVDLSMPGKYNVTVTGEMSMHGVTKTFSTPGTIEVTADGLVAVAEFKVNPEDYAISIPGVVRDKIAKEMTVSVNIKYLPVK
jgi:hypothetical protein